MTREKAIEEIKKWDFLDEYEKDNLISCLPEPKKPENVRMKENCIYFLELQRSHHASTEEIDKCIEWIKNLNLPD